MKILGLIPSRLKSKRLKEKALLKISGIPIVVHTYKRAKMSKLLDDLIVCTDSKKISKELTKFQAKFQITSLSHRNGTERIAELSKILDWPDETLVINLQADMPQLQCDNIDFLADKAKNNSGLSTLYYDLQSSESKKDTNTVKICINNNHISFCREVGSADKGDIFKHIGIYAYHVRDLKGYIKLKQSSNEKDLSLEQYRFVDNGYNIAAYFALSDPGASIDSLDNLNQL